METFESIRNSGKLLFESIRGSHLYGLNTETSDIDTFGVFIGPEEWFLGMGDNRQTFIKSEKSDNYWDELDKYFKELSESNPEALISLFTPQRFILYFDPVLQPLWDIRDTLVTKKCFKPFAGYAVSQIKKARGLKKAININPDMVKIRKTPLDFCQVPIGIGTWTLTKYLRDNNLKQEFCGISRLPGTVESYALFYDWAADINHKRSDLKVIGYRGILSLTDPLSSQLRLSNIPFDQRENPVCYFQFNSGAYSQHCTDYKRYWDWVKNRNESRFQLNKGFEFDSKNMCHCVRLLSMAIEISKGKGLLLDRTDIDRNWLLKIKNHEVSYDVLMKYVNNLEETMYEEFEKSSLPEEPDIKLLNDILIKIRKEFYYRNY